MKITFNHFQDFRKTDNRMQIIQNNVLKTCLCLNISKTYLTLNFMASDNFSFLIARHKKSRI